MGEAYGLRREEEKSKDGDIGFAPLKGIKSVIEELLSCAPGSR